MGTQREDQFDAMYMKMAHLHAGMSRGIRAKVGAVLVTKQGVMLAGYNGNPSGLDNNLEYIDQDTGELLTKPTVIHAELNCIMKAAREGVSVLDSKIYVTHSPCESCAAMLIQAGVRTVIYGEVYKNDKGLQYFSQRGATRKVNVNV